jgi:cytochrome c553
MSHMSSRSRLPAASRPPRLATPIGVALAVGLWAASVAAHAAAPNDPIARRVQACTLCHGPEGRATASGYFPRIAGKPAGYLHQQLLNFRDGRRDQAAMVWLVQHLSDDYLREMADWFAAQNLPYPPPQASALPPQQRARGEALVRQGDPARGIPACTACHGARMTGVQPAIPGLLGLPRDYLIGQLGAWRVGERRAVAPDCMAAIARRLAPEDVAAVADVLASSPVPADAKPALALPAPLPLDCGGVLR